MELFGARHRWGSPYNQCMASCKEGKKIDMAWLSYQLIAFGTKLSGLVHKNSTYDLRGPNTSQKLCTCILRGECLRRMEKIILPIHSCIKGICKFMGRKYRPRWLQKRNTCDGSTQSFPLRICFCCPYQLNNIPWKER